MKSLPSNPEHPNYFVPDIHEMSVERYNEVKPIWIRWRATERRFLPTELRKQPDTLMDDILYLDSVFDAMVGQRMEQYRQQNRDG